MKWPHETMWIWALNWCGYIFFFNKCYIHLQPPVCENNCFLCLLNHHSSCEVKMTSNCYFNLHNFNSEKENCSILQSLVYLFLCELSGLFLCHPMLSSLRKHFYSLIINWLLCYTWDNHISFSLSFLTKVFCHADIKNLYFSNLWVILFWLFCFVL